MKNKIMFTYLISALYFLISCDQKAGTETYLIHEGFTGRVNIILNQKQGSPAKFEGGRRVYEIPNDGILLTQFTINDGFIDRKYYYVDSIGNRIDLPVYLYDHDSDGTIRWRIKDNSEVGIFLDGTSGQYGNPPNPVWWQEFLVCSFNDEKTFFTAESKKQFEEKLKKKLNLDISIP